MTTYSFQSQNKRKSWLLLASFFVLIMAVGYAVSYLTGVREWLYFAVIFSFISSFVSYWYSDKIVLATSQAQPVERETNRELYRLVENLCIAAGLPVPKIYIIPDSAPNAFATGRDPEHAAIVFTTGILGKLEKVELEGVVAHELSHIGNRDILFSTLVTVMVGSVVLISDWLRYSMWTRHSDDNQGGGQAQLIKILLLIFLSILAPLAAYLMQFAFSRKREFLADASGALLTRYPEGLARALEKISGDNEPLEAANRATANLYIASPFKQDRGEKVSWITKAFATHPPIKERVEKLRKMNLG